MTRVRLTTAQELRAADVGYLRQKNALLKGLKAIHQGNLWGGHIESACSELAVALWTGLPWTGEPVWDLPPRVRVPDVGEKIEVRWSYPCRAPRLNFGEDDFDDRFYVLVEGYAPTYDIHGYIKGAEARELPPTVYPERRVHRVGVGSLRPLAGRASPGLSVLAA